MLQRLVLNDGTKVTLCPDHRKLIKDDIVQVDGREAGGKWACRVCTIHRRNTGDLAQPVSAFVRQYIVTRFPPTTDTPNGVTMCTCMAWRFQKGVAPANRWCKHIPEAVFA